MCLLNVQHYKEIRLMCLIKCTVIPYLEVISLCKSFSCWWLKKKKQHNIVICIIVTDTNKATEIKSFHGFMEEYEFASISNYPFSAFKLATFNSSSIL